jgi:hypothetical protein
MTLEFIEGEPEEEAYHRRGISVRESWQSESPYHLYVHANTVTEPSSFINHAPITTLATDYHVFIFVITAVSFRVALFAAHFLRKTTTGISRRTRVECQRKFGVRCDELLE